MPTTGKGAAKGFFALSSAAPSELDKESSQSGIGNIDYSAYSDTTLTTLAKNRKGGLLDREGNGHFQFRHRFSLEEAAAGDGN